MRSGLGGRSGFGWESAGKLKLILHPSHMGNFESAWTACAALPSGKPRAHLPKACARPA